MCRAEAATRLRPEFSLVVPARDEAANIEPLIREICAALDDHCRYEVIVVDDGSADDTAARVAALAHEIPHVRLLRHARCCGQSTALLTGARAARAPWIVTLDGDGQNDPADVPRLIDLVRGPDRPPDLALVVGHRRERRDTLLRRVSSRIANTVRARLLDDRTPDTGCGLKLIARETYLALPFFDHMHRFLPALIQRHGGRTLSVEVNHRPRRHGRSHYGTWDRMWAGIVDLLGVLWLKRRMTHPVLLDERGQP